VTWVICALCLDSRNLNYLSISTVSSRFNFGRINELIGSFGGINLFIEELYFVINDQHLRKVYVKE
jgi:hypothetical protein